MTAYDPPIRQKYQSVTIFGVSQTSAFAADVLSRSWKISAFIDPTERFEPKQFCGADVIPLRDINKASKLVSFDEYEVPAMLDFELFSLRQGESDIVSRELHTLDIVSLYRLAKTAWKANDRVSANYVDEFIFTKFNCRIPYTAEIGAGTTFGYGGIGVVVHKRSIIGKDCMIAQNVTLGGRVRGEPPVIGDNVYIAPGAKCLGGRIGNNVVVGANAVVITEVPDNCVVAGVPARVISTDMARYTGYFKSRS